jgi:hypothetical protein
VTMAIRNVRIKVETILPTRRNRNSYGPLPLRTGDLMIFLDTAGQTESTDLAGLQLGGHPKARVSAAPAVFVPKDPHVVVMKPTSIRRELMIPVC